MKLVDQWGTVEAGLPDGWDQVRLTLTTEQPGDLPRAAQVLAPISPGKVGESLVFPVTRAPGPRGVQTALHLFQRLDRERTWCLLEPSDVRLADIVAPGRDAAEAASSSVAASWDAALTPLPSDWTDLLCELEIDSSTLLDRTALLCAPLNPSRVDSRLTFSFRCSGRSGYGVSSTMARRCFERLDDAADHRPDARSSRAVRHGQRRHPGACLARGRQDALAQPRNSAANRSTSAATTRSLTTAASPSDSVRSGTCNERCIATDLRPSPAWSPR